MFLWFVGTAVIAVMYVFRDPHFDYRLLAVGSVLPLLDGTFGGARALHSVTTSVVLLVVVMLATRGRRRRHRGARRALLALPIGTFLHLVFDGAWVDTKVFWWPFGGWSFDDAPLRELERGWWGVVLELIGLAILAWVWRNHRLDDPAARHHLVTTGQLSGGH